MRAALGCSFAELDSSSVPPEGEAKLDYSQDGVGGGLPELVEFFQLLVDCRSEFPRDPASLVITEPFEISNLKP